MRTFSWIVPLILLAAATTACLEPSLVACAGGWVCPNGTRCGTDNASGPRCISTCGDGEIGPAEDCDGPSPGAADCTTLGFYGGELACNQSTCRYDTAGCIGSCGDGIVNGAEQCDGDETVTAGCVSVDNSRFDYGRVRCTAQCALDTTPCGYLGFDPVYETAMSIRSSCMYEPAPETVVAYLREAGAVVRVDAASAAAVGSGVGDERPSTLGCSSTDLVFGQSGLADLVGTTWNTVDLDPADKTTWVNAVSEFGGSLASVGYGGLVVTGRGGQWTVENYEDPSKPALLSVWIDPVTQVGYAGREDGQLLRRKVTPTSTTWTAVPDPGIGGLEWVVGLGPDDVLVGNPSGVYRLADGAWQRQAQIRPGPMFARGRSVWVAGQGAGQDGWLSHHDGRVWSRTTTAVGTMSKVWTTSAGSILVTLVGELQRARALWLSIVKPSTAVALARGGTDGPLWSLEFGAVRRNNAGFAAPAPAGAVALSALATPPGDVVFAVGGSMVARFDPALAAWQVQPWASSTLVAVAAIDATTAVAVGRRGLQSPAPSNGVVAVLRDGTWLETDLVGIPDLRGVAVTPSNELFAVGVGGTVLHSVDGITWSIVDLGLAVTANLNGVWAQPDSMVYVVGDGGIILRRSVNGTWARQTSPTLRTLNAISGNGIEMFAAGDGVILAFDGTGWSPIRPPSTSNRFTSVAVTAQEVYFAGVTTGSEGYILYRAR